MNNPVPRTGANQQSSPRIETRGRKNVAEIFRPAHLLVIFFVFTAMCSHHARDDQGSVLIDAAVLLDTISNQQDNFIPTAVFNHTLCVAVIPSLVLQNLEFRGDGVASCREPPERWGRPFLVTFTGILARSPHSNLVIFVLSNGGVRALQTANLLIRQRTPAPLARTVPVITQAELSADSLSYQHSSGKLSSGPVRGTIRRGTSDRTLAGKRIEGFLLSITSLFNSIIPAGIVIHHTAVVPTRNELPPNEHDVDHFHQALGLEILCFGRVYHIAYHYLVLADGTVKSGRPERCQGAHAKGYNSYLGISVVGDFSASVPSERQLSSLIQLCRRLQDRYNIPLQHIVRHSDISSTDCPGRQFPFRYVLTQLEQQPELAPRSER
jgi:N-acetylmuramoyl-L-alanine amidase